MEEENNGDKNEISHEDNQNELFFDITKIRSINQLSINEDKADN